MIESMICRRQDGSFVAMVNGLPYHVTEDTEALWAEAVAQAAELGDALSFEAPPERPPVTITDYRRAIQAHVDRVAHDRGYDSGVSCASYLNSTLEAWAAEARAFVVWRDAVWAHAYAELDKVKQGTREQPGVENFIGELPAIEWAG